MPSSSHERSRRPVASSYSAAAKISISALELAMAGDCELDDLEFDIREMTDEEVAEIPDC